MTTEELLTDRYLVTNPYPQGVFKFTVGEILVRKGIHFSGASKSINEKEIIKYPHLFKPLPWYAERKVEDMPEYVKDAFVPVTSEFHRVFKIDLYDKADNLIIANGAKFSYFFIDTKLPATQLEYEQQNNTTNE